MTETNGHIEADEGPMWEPESQTVMLLTACLKLARENKISSMGLVLVTEPGKFQVTAAGPDVDGMYAGAKELVKQLKKLVDTLPPHKTIIHA